jgi:phosphohistidine phosphatase
MKLYVMQHGKAMAKADHPDRPLTPEGREEVTRMAEFLGRAGIPLDQIWHSGKTRAEQTAEIVGNQFQIQVVAATGLGPTDDVRPVAEDLQTEQHATMIVGHLPFMGQLVSHLLTGNPGQAVVQFQQGGVVCLEREDDVWQIVWMVVPDILSA